MNRLRLACGDLASRVEPARITPLCAFNTLRIYSSEMPKRSLPIMPARHVCDEATYRRSASRETISPWLVSLNADPTIPSLGRK